MPLNPVTCFFRPIKSGSNNNKAAKSGKNITVYCCVSTALLPKLSEALNLAWTDINEGNLWIEVYRQKTDSLTLVPISNRVLELFRNLHHQDAPFIGMSRAVKVLRRVIDHHCNGSTNQNVSRGKATIHSLRDTYASRLANRGMSLHKISLLLGHSSVTMTRKYAHLDIDGLADEARVMLDGKLSEP